MSSTGVTLTAHMQISWTMARTKDAPAPFTRYFIRSVCYRSSVRLKYLAIPENPVAFFTHFLDDVHEKWLQLVTAATEYISHSVSPPLYSTHTFIPKVVP